jgi:hypothetical protein
MRTNRDEFGMAYGIKKEWNKIRKMIRMVMSKEQMLNSMTIDPGL